MAPPPNWQYDAGEHRHKHCWNRPYADVLSEGAHRIGKCPNSLSKEQARVLLTDAVYVPKGGVAQPERMWTVHEGVIYEAVPTQPGSYHGYPWCGRPGMNRLPRQILAALTQMAQNKGCLPEFKDWVKKYG